MAANAPQIESAHNFDMNVILLLTNAAFSPIQILGN